MSAASRNAPGAQHAPDVTFVIALYESADTVERAIGSALAQAGVRSEVIVVDDRSPGGVAPAAVALAAKHPDRVRLVRRERNGGPAAARNDALPLARGAWIAVLDSDDAVAPDRTRDMLSWAGGADVLIDNPIVPRRGGDEPMFPPDAWGALGDIDLATFARRNGLFERGFTLGYSKPMIRRATLERHGLRYDEALRIGEDYHLLADLLARGARLRAVPVRGYRYHVREGSVSRVLRLEHVRALRKADARHRARWPEPSAPVRAALDARGASLARAEAFLRIVGAVKGRRWLDALRIAIAAPRAMRLLTLPIGARLRRARNRLSATQSAESSSAR